MTCRFSESVFVLCNCWIRQDWGIYFEYLIVCSGYRHILWVSNMTNTKKRIESKQNIGTYRNTTCVDKNTIFASCFFPIVLSIFSHVFPFFGILFAYFYICFPHFLKGFPTFPLLQIFYPDVGIHFRRIFFFELNILNPNFCVIPNTCLGMANPRLVWGSAPTSANWLRLPMYTSMVRMRTPGRCV
jgi:hypothetical protein